MAWPNETTSSRGIDGAFRAAVKGIESCLDVGLKTGLRYTVTQQNVDDFDDVVDLLTDVGLDRFCFYHLSYSGRGETLDSVDLDTDERRAVVNRICDRTVRSHREGDDIETLLVGNYADAAYLVEYARREFGEDAARRVYGRLARNGGSRIRAPAADNGLFEPDPQCYFDASERHGSRPTLSAS